MVYSVSPNSVESLNLLKISLQLLVGFVLGIQIWGTGWNRKKVISGFLHWDIPNFWIR